MQSGSVRRHTGCLRCQLPVRARRQVCGVLPAYVHSSDSQNEFPSRILHKKVRRALTKKTFTNNNIAWPNSTAQSKFLFNERKAKGRRAGISVAAPNAAHAAEIMRYNNLATIVSEARRRLLCEVAAFMHSYEKLNFWSSFSWCAGVLISQQHTWRSMSEDPRAHPPIIIHQQSSAQVCSALEFERASAVAAAAVSWLQPLCVEWPPGLIVRTKNA